MRAAEGRLEHGPDQTERSALFYREWDRRFGLCVGEQWLFGRRRKGWSVGVEVALVTTQAWLGQKHRCGGATEADEEGWWAGSCCSGG